MQISSLQQTDNIQNYLGSFPASSKSTEAEDNTNEAYRLNISDRAQQAYAASQSQINRFTNPNLTGQLPDNLQKNVNNLQNNMNRILHSYSISTDRELKFTINDDGKIVLNGDYPDKETIENALNGNAEFVAEARSTLNKVSSEAQSQLNDKKELRLKEHEEDDDEKKKKQNELERQMSVKARAVYISQQISAASNDFTFSGGTISFASLNIAQSTIF